jgi:DNA gyrase subunit A
VGTPQARGKAMVNLLPLSENEKITTIMTMPEDDAECENLQLIFATKSGTVRRNELSDFVRINRNGKIAMKLDDGDAIIGVHICGENEDVLLTSRNGRCIRFKASDVRVFAGRNSTGVRGIKLGPNKEMGDDEVISMAVLRHVDSNPPEARAYLKLRRQIEGADRDELDETVEIDGDDDGDDVNISPERYAELSAAEQFLLTVSEHGFGKRSSAFEYRVTGRGGKGIIAMAVTKRNGPLIASFPVEDADEIMLVTDGGQLIRCPINDVRVAGRSTQGVTIFKTAEEERVVSVEHISEVDDDDEEDDANGDDVPSEGESGEDGAAT